ncbi:hypothetical protein WA026_010159 [Henosepilachna vigintioctopunctata]|uniref:Uncharacterized protein n=1 Tax=Henosepilachna vigintioctopunctata TaxID=420089 RepID=A0AAW1U9H2_9CUCU
MTRDEKSWEFIYNYKVGVMKLKGEEDREMEAKQRKLSTLQNPGKKLKKSIYKRSGAVGLTIRNCEFSFRSGLRQEGRNRKFFSGSAPTTSHPHITIFG